MGFASYLWDKMPAVVCNAAGIIAVGVFTGVSAGASVAVPIAACWLAAVAAYLAVGWLLLKKRIAAAKRIADETEDKFLLSEVVPAPSRAEDRLYYEFMLIQGRAAIERAEAAGRDAAEYREYIQEWVHEIKVPITAASLVCRRSEGEDFREIGRQLDRIYGYVEQALYEARSGCAEKDVLIRETELAAVVADVLVENKRQYIDAGASIDVDVTGTAATDGKWLGFVLKQILQNSVQYAREGGAHIKITSSESPSGTELSVLDDGTGIKRSELPRIFDKGFCGSNGRNRRRSTGLGLYMCRRMCSALGATISADSEFGSYTRVTIKFPQSYDSVR